MHPPKTLCPPSSGRSPFTLGLPFLPPCHQAIMCLAQGRCLMTGHCPPLFPPLPSLPHSSPFCCSSLPSYLPFPPWCFPGLSCHLPTFCSHPSLSLPPLPGLCLFAPHPQPRLPDLILYFSLSVCLFLSLSRISLWISVQQKASSSAFLHLTVCLSVSPEVPLFLSLSCSLCPCLCISLPHFDSLGLCLCFLSLTISVFLFISFYVLISVSLFAHFFLSLFLRFSLRIPMYISLCFCLHLLV